MQKIISLSKDIKKRGVTGELKKAHYILHEASLIGNERAALMIKQAQSGEKELDWSYHPWQSD